VAGKTGEATRNALGSDPRVVSYDAAGRLVWSSHIAVPARPDFPADDPVPPDGIWEDALAGDRRVRMFYFGGENALHGVGFPAASAAEHGGRLLRLLVLVSLFGVSLLTATFPLLASWTRTMGLLPELFRWMGGSHSRKLAAAVLLASLVPLAGLAVVLRLSLERQRDEILLGLGLRTLGVAERVVQDAMVAADQDGLHLPDDDTLFWLSRVIRQEIDLFVGGRLAASSRRGLYTSGILSPLAPAAVYSQIALQGQHVLLVPGRADEPTTTTINASLRTGPGEPAILSLPLHIQKEEVEGRIHEIQQLAELATAAVALLLVATSLLLGRGMSGRIKRLSHATQQLATGDETVRIPPGPTDEIGRLSRSFNRMADALVSRRAALQRRTETLEKLIVHAPIGIISVDAGNRVGMLNPSAAKVLAASPATGIPVEDLLRGSPFGRGLLDLLRRRESDGSPCQIEMSPEGEDDRRLRAVLVELPGAAGGRLLLLEDITEAVRSNRLAAWAEMARRIAHEIKNPLTPIRLSAEHLQRVYEQGDPRFAETLARSLETILQQVEALREISSDFSLYARIPAIRRQPVDPGRLVLETLAPYRSAPPDGIQIEQDVAAGLPSIPLDEGLIRRALVNLVENALQSMPEGGTLSLSCRLTEDGRQVEIQVSDTGVGMDRDTLRDLFEPYFSTRDAGTGLGLAITRRAVEEHGGTVRVKSSPGSGSTFTVALPTGHERPATR
jgi:signal transduction histidine kinase